MTIDPTTICAVATAPGGALGIIRISGPDSIRNVAPIFHPQNASHTLSQRPSHTVTYGEIRTPQGEVIDDVLLTLFRAPHSYTGEEAIEMSCHGSPYILQRIIELLLAQGCSMAAPGEFTQRAFLNGRMDLCQAEGVADLIAARSASVHKQAISQMRGGISKELLALREKLIHISSLLELELDFGDHEDIQLVNQDEILETTALVSATIRRLTDSFRAGNALKNGIPVAIIGQTNAGKSTLLNTLLQENKAIVSNTHGTTRDIIEDSMNINGVIFRFIDTAGIRETSNDIERLGIERSFKAIEKAEIVLLVHDMRQSGRELEKLYRAIAPSLKDKKVILVLNKMDVSPLAGEICPHITVNESIRISAQQGTNIEKLKALILSLSAPFLSTSADTTITNIRHYEALKKADAALLRVTEGLHRGLAADLISQDLRETVYHLSDIIGEVTTDDILHQVFSAFCIGK